MSMAREKRDVNRKNERRRAPSSFSASDSIQTAFMLACETGHIEKVFKLNSSKCANNTNKNVGKVRAAIVLGVDVNMKAGKSRYS